MSTIVTQNGASTYLVKLAAPERHWLTDTARDLGITRPAMLAACIGHGLTHYTETFRERPQNDEDESHTSNGV